jgi:hypothetical protein
MRRGWTEEEVRRLKLLADATMGRRLLTILTGRNLSKIRQPQGHQAPESDGG